MSTSLCDFCKRGARAFSWRDLRHRDKPNFYFCDMLCMNAFIPLYQGGVPVDPVWESAAAAGGRAFAIHMQSTTGTDMKGQSWSALNAGLDAAIHAYSMDTRTRHGLPDGPIIRFQPENLALREGYMQALDYLITIGKSDLITLSPDEWKGWVDALFTGYFQKYHEMSLEAPF